MRMFPTYSNLYLGCCALLFVFTLLACAGKSPPITGATATHVRQELPRMGYTIQVGAFAKVENAARLADRMRERGLNAIYYVSHENLYKVRIGNYPTRDEARRRAEHLRSSGLIEEYYLVAPETFAVADRGRYGSFYLRHEIVKTAETFLGVPYLWGGTSAEEGFDCSGLAMTVYQLNGLDLPRHSAHQFEAGAPVGAGGLQPGDLVFFHTRNDGKISHVGIYVGNGDFIHAAGTGKDIRRDSLFSAYFKTRYLGGRSYL